MASILFLISVAVSLKLLFIFIPIIFITSLWPTSLHQSPSLGQKWDAKVQGALYYGALEKDVSMKYPPVHYGDYLQLDKILDAQHPKSREYGQEAHDETLFIVIHQVYELWFKQIIHELESIYTIMNTDNVSNKLLSTVVHRMHRITEIQRLLNDQLAVIETMTPLDFMEFRDYLVPASGFQSIQFRKIEVMLGLKQKYRLGIDAQFFNSRLKEEEKKALLELEQQPTLLELVDNWLSRLPFDQDQNYNFWQDYQKAVDQMLAEDEKIISNNKTLTEKEKVFELKNLEATRKSLDILFDKEAYTKLEQEGLVRISRKSRLATIFISLFRDEPIMHLPNQLLNGLIEIDENFTTWRYRHAIMVHRMLGTKIGTGGSSGHDYLKRATENNRVFQDFFNMATYLIPKNKTPQLPTHIYQKLGFVAESEN